MIVTDWKKEIEYFDSIWRVSPRNTAERVDHKITNGGPYDYETEWVDVPLRDAGSLSYSDLESTDRGSGIISLSRNL